MMNKSKFLEEIKSYSSNDLRLIESTQQNLYTEEEMTIIREMIVTKEHEEKAEEEEFIKAHLPKEIICPKCDGVNPFENDNCCFCGYTFDKNKYYDRDYYANTEDNTTIKEKEKEKGNSYTFQYVISFLIPLVGFILGAILLSKDNEEEKSVGKSCIILGIVAVIINTIIIVLIL